jgi:hypothetical protein
VVIGSSTGGKIQVSNQQKGQPADPPAGGGKLSVGSSANGVVIGSSKTRESSPAKETGRSAVDSSEGQVRIGGGAVEVQSGSRAREPRSSPSGSDSQADSGGPGAVIDDSRLERRTRPVSCVGTTSEDLTGVLLRVDDVAIAGIGSCTIRIKNSHIIGNIALQINGSTTVSIDNSIIEGVVALQLRGSVNMSVRASTIRGAVQKSGPVKLRDLGGNLWR